MSRKVLIIATVVALLVATLAVPVLGSSLDVEDAAPVQAETGLAPSASSPVWPLDMLADGGCEGGNGGGCPT